MIFKNKNFIFIFLSVLSIIIFGFIAYGNSISGNFVWDDDFLVKENSFIKELNFDNIKKIFTTNLGAGAGRIFQPYRPIQILTFAVDYSIGYLNVEGYHLTNILLHILMALAIYWLINILFSDKFISLFTGIFYVVHPIHTEAVAYISGRADSLSGLFIILCVIFYVKYCRTNDLSCYLFVLISYTLALFSREISLITPILLLLYNYTFRQKIRILNFVPLIIITVIFLFIRDAVLSRFIFKGSSLTLMQRLPGFFVALPAYIKLMILPFNLHMGYGEPLFSFLNPKAMAGAAILVFLFIWIAKARKDNNKIVFFALSWFIITLLPQSNIVSVSSYMAEHWLYLPSIGFFLIFAFFIKRLSVNKIAAACIGLFAVCLLIFYTSLTIDQNNYWKDPITFYEKTLKYVDYNPKLYVNLGSLYYDAGNYDKAIIFYRKGAELDPKSAAAYFNLGNAYSNTGETDKAVEAYRKAIELKPGHKEARNALNRLLSNAEVRP